MVATWTSEPPGVADLSKGEQLVLWAVRKRLEGER
jgi:hypothetical protein